MDLVMYVFGAIVFGLFPAFIAVDKGRNFYAWWAYGAVIFVVAFVHALLIKTRPGFVAKQA